MQINNIARQYYNYLTSLEGNRYIHRPFEYEPYEKLITNKCRQDLQMPVTIKFTQLFDDIVLLDVESVKDKHKSCYIMYPKLADVEQI